MSGATLTRAEAEDFLYREARLMDEHRYREWLALWDSEALYWAPCNADDIDPKRHVSIFYDDRTRLEQRVDRLESGSVLAQDPVPSMRRIVSNVELGAADGEAFSVASNFMLAIARGAGQQIWAGRSLHTLRRRDGALKIAVKKVLLNNNDQEMRLLQFLI